MTDADPDANATSGPGRRRGGPPLLFAVLGIGGLVAAVLIVAVQALGLGVSGAVATMPPTGAAAQLTHDLVVQTLQGAAFQVQDPQTPYRPAESASLINVPRRLVQAVLPSDPKGGYVVIYELPSAGEADRVGRDLAAYLGGGTGAIQYPRDARFVIRRLGPTLVFFPWSPSVSPDPRVAELAAALETIGVALSPG
jgi:hypothetical protein